MVIRENVAFGLTHRKLIISTGKGDVPVEGAAVEEILMRVDEAGNCTYQGETAQVRRVTYVDSLGMTEFTADLSWERFIAEGRPRGLTAVAVEYEALS